MKRLLPFLSIAVLLASFGNTNAQTASCQNLTVQLDNTGNYAFAVGNSIPQTDADQPVPGGVTAGTSAWQSFTPTLDGLLYSVSLNFAASYSPSLSVTLDIYSGEGVSGSLLYSKVFANPVTFSGMTEFILDAPLDVVSGNQYTISLGATVDPFSLTKNDTDPYPGGRNHTGLTSDLLFSTKILQRPDVDNGSSSTSGLASFSVDISSFSCADLGLNTVTLTVTDNSSSSNSCTATVTVQDNETPVAVCQNTAVTLDATGNATITALAIDNGSSDNCSITYTASQTMFNCADVGTNTVTLTVEDPAGNSATCNATVTVSDNMPPTASCQDHTLVLDGTGSATLTVANINNGSSDNCGISTMTLSKTAFNCSDLGTNSVTLTVNDVNGNSSTCSATVTVQDNQTPVINCPADITVCADNTSGAVVTYPAVTGSDNCTYNINQTDVSGLTSGDVFPIGTTLQQWTIVDVASNSASCQFSITVNAKPVANYGYSAACQGEAVFFTDLSTIDPSSSIVSWQWNMDDGSTPIGLVNPIHAFSDTGMYDVQLTVTSAEGCTDMMTQSVHVTPVPSASFTVANNCEGNATLFTNTSTIDAGTLTYNWNFGDSSMSSDQHPSHIYATDGTYTVTLTVTSDNGCTDVATGSVEVYDSPTSLFSASTECFGSATEFTNLSFGNGTLSYLWDFGDSNTSSDADPSHTYAVAGNYSVTLTTTNNNGCTDTHSASITVHALPNAGFTFTDVCEGTPTPLVNTSDAGSYNWDLGDGNSSTLTHVNHTYSSFGAYDVTLTVTDVNFCISSITQQVEVYDLPDFTLTTTDVNCYGEATGSIVADPQGNPVFPWSFTLNNSTPQINDTFIGLPAGPYTVTVSDNNGCQYTLGTVVNQPSDTLGASIISLTDILCHGQSTGVIEVTGTGGTSPYSYSVNAGTLQPTGTFAGLPAGTHALHIEDANLCVFDTTITLTEPDTLVLALIQSEDLLCNGDHSGTLTVSGAGGVYPYQFNIDGGTYSSDSTFSGLAAATYIVGIKDANGCTDTLHVTLNEPGILMLSVLDMGDALCFGEANGFIETAASSGTPGYTYSLDGVNFVGSGLFEGLAAGTYTVTAMDANGCTDVVTATIFQPSLLTIETNSAPVACFGQSSGSIQIIASGGTPNYSYSIDDGNTFSANGGTFSGLTAGTYLTVVQDNNGCSVSEGVSIAQPNAPFDLNATITDALCLGEASGTALLSGTGGTPTYMYSSDNSSFTSNNLFSGFAAGTYTLYGKDLNGCADSVQFNISEPATAVNITNVLLNNPACPNQTSGTALVQVSGGTPGYLYSGNGGNTFQTNSIITGLNGGNHLIVVKDANGCTDTDTITLVSPPLLDIVVDTIIHVACENDLTGAIHVTGQGGTPSYTYTLNGGNLQTNGTYNNLTDGTYSITITDVNGCTHMEDLTISAEQMQPVADFSWTSSGQAVLFTDLSQFGDTYLWEFGDDSTSTAQQPIHVYQQDGNYEVTLTVSNSCGTSTVTHSVSTINTGIEQVEDLFRLYPNPTSGQLFIELLQTTQHDLRLEVMSISGQVMMNKKLSRANKTTVLPLDVSTLAQGMYYLRLTGDEQHTVLRFDIIK